MRNKPAADDDASRWKRTGVQAQPTLRRRIPTSERGRRVHRPTRVGLAAVDVVDARRSGHSSLRWPTPSTRRRTAGIAIETAVCGPRKGAFCRCMNDLRKTQASFARKAQAQPTHRFGDLYHLICRDEWLREALGCVLRNAGSRTAGIDGISRNHLQEQPAQAAFIETLQHELRNGTYRPQPVRRQWIPKANGQRRGRHPDPKGSGGPDGA
jgi:hypothetical protein